MKLTKIRNQREAKKFSYLGGLPYEEVRKFSISGRGLPHEGGGRGGGVVFYGEVHILCILCKPCCETRTIAKTITQCLYGTTKYFMEALA